MRYKRARIQGGTYFFTLVTFKRKKILTVPENVKILRRAFRYVMDRHAFTIDAFILLPNHLHCIWILPKDDYDYSTRWQLIKSYFTRNCDNKFKQRLHTSGKKKKKPTVWQPRFWEHVIRDEQDMIKHVEYIHYNPVKHGLVKAAGGRVKE